MFDEDGNHIYPVELQVLDDYQLILVFSNGKTKLFDCAYLLEKTIYAPLNDPAVFKAASIAGGVLQWCDGELDVAPETLYLKSIEYEHPTAEQQREIDAMREKYGLAA